MEDFDSESDGELSELIKMLGKLTDAFRTVPEGIEVLRNNIAGIPRISVKYNRAKKVAVTRLDLTSKQKRMVAVVLLLIPILIAASGLTIWVRQTA